MPQQQRLATPDLKKLESAKKAIDNAIDTDNIGGLNETILITASEACDWIITFVENRRDYHKHRNIKTKIELDLLRSRLESEGVDLKEIDQNASRIADNKITDGE